MRMKSLVCLVLLLSMLVIPVASQTDEPTFSDVVFATDVTLLTNEPISPLRRFPNNIPVIIGLVDISGLSEGTVITSEWILNGAVETSSVYTHESTQSNFRLWTNLSNNGGIPTGEWTLRFSIDGEPVRESTVEVTSDPFVFPIRFGTACGIFTGELFGQREVYEDGTQTIFAQLRFVNFPQRTAVEGVWFFDGEELTGAGLPIQTTFTGNGQRCMRISDLRGLPPGTYDLKIRLDDTILRGGTIEVNPLGDNAVDSGN